MGGPFDRQRFDFFHRVHLGLGDFDLYLMDVDAGGGPGVRLTDYPGFDCFPVFSPDGRRLVFSSNRDGATPYQTSIFLADFIQ